jgi:hypothetical protein
MATQLGRWRRGTILIGARDDAFLPSVADGLVRARTSDAAPGLDGQEGDEPQGPTHVHVYLDGWAPTPPAARTHDAASSRHPVRGDRAGGRRINLAGRDAEGQNWKATIYGPGVES